MRSVPKGVDAGDLEAVLARQWGLPPDRLEYAPVGGGAYHWVLFSGDSKRFVTVDDLDTKPWLGTDRESAYAGLLRAYETAHDLRRGPAGSFVVAPEPTTSGGCAVRLTDQYSVAVFPYLGGAAGEWGESVDRAAKGRLVGLLARLHDSTPADSTPRRHDIGVPDRERFEHAIADLGGPWNGGPFADAARRELAAHREQVADWFGCFDELAAQVMRAGGEPVVTHGEPHPGNLVRSRGEYFLVDWDTVALGRPERDLWMLDDGSGDVSTTYQELTGRSVDAGAMTLYRLGWKLADLVSFTLQLRASHDRDADTEKALWAIRSLLAAEEPTPYGDPARTV